jgi:sulfur-oxidizing protein SoxA
VHRRFQFCNEQARALPFNIFSDEYNALQLYLTNRGNGLKIETPSVRK